MKKQANKTPVGAAEPVERRGSAKGNSSNRPVASTQRLTESEEGLARVRAAARKGKDIRLTSLFHHLSFALLERAYGALKKKAAVGVDGLDWLAYGEGLTSRLIDLLERLHSGCYRAQPVRRVWIDKPDGGTRPLGVACIEDKVVQQAMVWVLESIYEEDFLGFSYGFRPKRSPHKALDALYMALTVKKASFVLDADIQTFFDNVEHDHLMRFLEHRIGDRRVLKLIEQTLKAGIVDDGAWQATEQGIAQGTVISPLLANIYLHYCLDQWAHQWRGRYAEGEAYIVRYADDVVCCFQSRSDATRFKRALIERLKRFGLKLHPEKTRLIEFGRFAAANRRERGEGKPETFDFLGFTHICSTRYSDGGFTVRRQTIAKRLRSKIKEVRVWLKLNRCIPIEVQGRKISAVIKGALNYYGVPGNLKAMAALRTEICKSWFSALRRRSQKAQKLTWRKMQRIVAQYVPKIRVTHPYPNERLCV